MVPLRRWLSGILEKGGEKQREVWHVWRMGWSHWTVLMVNCAIDERHHDICTEKIPLSQLFSLHDWFHEYLLSQGG